MLSACHASATTEHWPVVCKTLSVRYSAFLHTSFYFKKSFECLFGSLVRLWFLNLNKGSIVKTMLVTMPSSKWTCETKSPIRAASDDATHSALLWNLLHNSILEFCFIVPSLRSFTVSSNSGLTCYSPWTKDLSIDPLQVLEDILEIYPVTHRRSHGYNWCLLLVLKHIRYQSQHTT